MISYKNLKSNNSSDFERFFEIYQSSINKREQKSHREISQMPLRSDYKILLLLRLDQTIGFSILYLNEEAKFGLLEYMAIDETERAHGFGSELLKETFKSLKESHKFEFGIIEVDSPYEKSIDQKLREKRIHFYAKNGCSQIDQLNYILPLPGEGSPPEMLLMVYPIEESKNLTMEILNKWLTSIYQNVYACSDKDSRIDFMLKSMREPIKFLKYN